MSKEEIKNLLIFNDKDNWFGFFLVEKYPKLMYLENNYKLIFNDFEYSLDKRLRRISLHFNEEEFSIEINFFNEDLIVVFNLLEFYLNDCYDKEKTGEVCESFYKIYYYKNFYKIHREFIKIDSLVYQNNWSIDNMDLTNIKISKYRKLDHNFIYDILEEVEESGFLKIKIFLNEEIFKNTIHYGISIER